MNSQENLKLSGKLKIVVTGQDGVVKDTRELDNLVVTSGLRWITSSMAKTDNTTTVAMTHMGIGNGTDEPAAAQTDLTGTLKKRVALASGFPKQNENYGTYTLDSTKANIVYEAEFGSGTQFETGQTSAVTEAGIFNSGTEAGGGTMLCRTKFPVVNKGINDTMKITWIITLQASTTP